MSDAPNLRKPDWAFIPLVVLVMFTFVFLKIGSRVLTSLRSDGLPTTGSGAPGVLEREESWLGNFGDP